MGTSRLAASYPFCRRPCLIGIKQNVSCARSSEGHALAVSSVRTLTGCRLSPCAVGEDEQTLSIRYREFLPPALDDTLRLPCAEDS